MSDPTPGPEHTPRRPTLGGMRKERIDQLATAGTDYPSWVKPYLDVRPGSIGESVSDAAAEAVAAIPSGQRDPYHVALAIQDYLYSDGGFSYTTDLRGECAGENLVDCFMRIKKGYCEYFATAMVMMLRDQGRLILIVTHHLHLAARRCDRVWVLSDGQLSADGSPGEAMRPDKLEAVFHVPFQRYINEQGSVFVSYG